MNRLVKIILSFLIMSVIMLSCHNKNIKSPTVMENGLVIKKSNQDFEKTYTDLRNALETNPNLKIILELDHSKNAASKGLNLRPTRIIVFGNPMLGTPLMENQPTLAIDLPQKIVVYQLENGKVEVVYNNPMYLKERHQLGDLESILMKVSNALDAISNVAIGK